MKADTGALHEGVQIVQIVALVTFVVSVALPLPQLPQHSQAAPKASGRLLQPNPAFVYSILPAPLTPGGRGLMAC